MGRIDWTTKPHAILLNSAHYFFLGSPKFNHPQDYLILFLAYFLQKKTSVHKISTLIYSTYPIQGITDISQLKTVHKPKL